MSSDTFSDTRKTRLLQFQKNLLLLEKEDSHCFDDSHFLSELPNYIHALIANTHYDVLARLIEKIGLLALAADAATREKSLLILLQSLELSTLRQDTQLLRTFTTVIAKWLAQENSLLSGYDAVNSCFAKLLAAIEQSEPPKELEFFFLVLNSIINGLIPKPPALLKTLKRIYLHSPSLFSSKQDTFQTIQADPLIRELFTSESRERRLRIVSMLSQISEYITDILISRAHENPSWYILRNTVDIIVCSARSEHFSLLFSFLDLPDSRIHSYILAHIDTLSETDSKGLLLQLLERAPDEIKLQTIPLLSRLDKKDQEVTLISLLNRRKSFDPQLRNTLVEKVIREMANLPSIYVAHSLELFISEQEQFGICGNPLSCRARKTVTNFWKD